MDTLFPIPEQLSPRLAWMRRHDVHTRKSSFMQAGEAPWSAWVGDLSEAISTGGDYPEAGGVANAESEEEAIGALAQARGLKLWNEEEPI